MTDLTAPLDAFVSRYAAIIDGVGYEEMKALQDGPHVPLGSGAAGTAHVLVRLASASRLPVGARRAATWLRDASRDRSTSAFRSPDQPRYPSSSLMFGRAGVHATVALLHASTERRAEYRASRAAFARSCRSARPPTLELMHGTAGQLLGVCTLLEQVDDASLRALGDELADRLADRIRRRARRPWSPQDVAGIAHSWAGAIYALATWRLACSRETESWLAEAAAALARVWSPDVAPTGMRGTWCNGAAGAALLWCRAYECTRERAFLGLARDAARSTLRHLPAPNHLCCGRAGAAYALLALHRSDPRGGWYARALRIGSAAIAEPLRSRWPNGLLWGHPGLVCLALDLLAGEPCGFPWVDPVLRRSQRIPAPPAGRVADARV